jgi:hypothetical protein
MVSAAPYVTVGSLLFNYYKMPGVERIDTIDSRFSAAPPPVAYKLAGVKQGEQLAIKMELLQYKINRQPSDSMQFQFENPKIHRIHPAGVIPTISPIMHI